MVGIVIFSLIILLFSVVVHEVSHGAMAYVLGDSTAKQAGRLSLNPLRHIDIFGSVILPLLLLVLTMGQGPVFGWAKPVPINPANLSDRRWGQLKVALAGPAANFLLAVFFGLANRFLPWTFAYEAFAIISIYNLALAIFNLMPLPPLDGSHILFSLLPPRFNSFKIFLTQYGTVILLFFIFFGFSWLSFLAVGIYQFIAR